MDIFVNAMTNIANSYITYQYVSLFSSMGMVFAIVLIMIIGLYILIKNS